MPFTPTSNLVLSFNRFSDSLICYDIPYPPYSVDTWRFNHHGHLLYIQIVPRDNGMLGPNGCRLSTDPHYLAQRTPSSIFKPSGHHDAITYERRPLAALRALAKTRGVRLELRPSGR